MVTGCTVGPLTSSSTTAPASRPSIEVLPTIGTATLLPTTTANPTTGPTNTHTTTPHTTVATTTTVRANTGWPLAFDVLGFVVVENEHGGGYVRDLFGYPADTDHDGCNTRAEVLMRESSVAVTHSAGHCTVITGRWVSRYDGLVSTSAAAFAIDHVVPLKEAWDSGAWAWSATTRFAYGNDLTDPRTLRAVSMTSNSSKGDKDPSNWLPSSTSDVCPYVADWVSIKVRWQLSMDSSEYGRIRNLLRGQCVGTRVAPWSAPPVPVPNRAPSQGTPVTAAPITAAPVTNPSNVYFANCAAAWAAGAAPLHLGEPGYRAGLDRDHDGVACENPP